MKGEKRRVICCRLSLFLTKHLLPQCTVFTWMPFSISLISLSLTVHLCPRKQYRVLQKRPLELPLIRKETWLSSPSCLSFRKKKPSITSIFPLVCTPHQQIKWKKIREKKKCTGTKKRRKRRFGVSGIVAGWVMVWSQGHKTDNRNRHPTVTYTNTHKFSRWFNTHTHTKVRKRSVCGFLFNREAVKVRFPKPRKVC